MNAAIYCRVSTGGQADGGTSLETQLEACQKKATELGYRVVPDFVFREVWSGAELDDRRDLTRLRQAAKERAVDAVICFSTDRLSRKPLHLGILVEEFQKRKVDLVFVTEPLDSSPEGQLIVYVKGYAAQLEREKIRERSLRGKRARALSGKIPAGSHTHMFGYVYDKATGTRKVDDYQAHWVRQIFEWARDGLPIRSITRNLDEAQVETYSGLKHWNKSTVQKMLRNRAYVGETYAFMVHAVEPKMSRLMFPKCKKSLAVSRPRNEWISLPGVTPQIVDLEVFEKVQERMVAAKRRVVCRERPSYLLHGFVVCGRCGARYRGKIFRHRNKDGSCYEWKRYVCSKSSYCRDSLVPTDLCEGRPVKADEAEAAVWNMVQEILRNPEGVIVELERRKGRGKNLEYLMSEIGRVDVKLNALDKQYKRLVAAVRFGFEEEYIAAAKVSVDKEKEVLQDERRTIVKKVDEIRGAVDVDIEGVKQFCSRLNDRLAMFGDQEKRKAMQALKVKVVVEQEGLILLTELPAELISRLATRFRCERRGILPKAAS
jgi:site-specific DNA recombinase